MDAPYEKADAVINETPDEFDLNVPVGMRVAYAESYAY